MPRRNLNFIAIVMNNGISISGMTCLAMVNDSERKEMLSLPETIGKMTGVRNEVPI